jgi:hypothetical protein
LLFPGRAKYSPGKSHLAWTRANIKGVENARVDTSLSAQQFLYRALKQNPFATQIMAFPLEKNQV